MRLDASGAAGIIIVYYKDLHNIIIIPENMDGGQAKFNWDSFRCPRQKMGVPAEAVPVKKACLAYT